MIDSIKVLVVGAGPAGCSASFFIKNFDKDNKIDVELVDRLQTNDYDSYHDICGEAVSDEILTDLEPIRPKGLIGKIRKIREFYPNNIEIQTKMNGFFIDRPRFFQSIIDEFIKHGGIYKKNTVEDFSYAQDKVKIKFNEGYREYDYVIAADGANSLFRKKIGIVGNTKLLIQYIIDKEPEKDTIQFFYDEKYQGDYMWEFPHNEKTKIGYPFIKGKIFKPKEKILIKQARKIGYGGLDTFIQKRILFVGDAACQTNPMTNGGIRASIVAGKLVANAIVTEDPNQYEWQWLKTKFSSKIFNEGFEQLKKMNNDELAKHIKPFSEVKLDNLISRGNLHIKIFLFYKKYLKLYKAYDLANKFGW